MKTIYKILDSKNVNGDWFETYEVDNAFPVVYGFTDVVPPEDLSHPKWDYGTASWVEDWLSVTVDLTAENNQLKDILNSLTDRADMTESALLDLADMILSR